MEVGFPPEPTVPVLFSTDELVVNDVVLPTSPDHIMKLEMLAACFFPTVARHGSGFSVTTAV